MTFYGVQTMALQEFRLRLRAGRWRWLVAAWFVVLLGFTFLVWLALDKSGYEEQPYYGSVEGAPVERAERYVGTPMFGGLMFFVLGILLLVVPALTAQSVNGDRERGVLATLQTTLLTPAEIAVGKLLAAWATAAVFVAAALPMVVWSMVEGGVGFVRAAVAILVVLLLLGMVCAVAQCLSTLVARTSTSAVLSYLFVFAMTALTAISFGLALPATAHQRTIVEFLPVYPDFDPNNPPTSAPTPIRYERYEYVQSEPDSSRVWWLLAPNPFVILADGAPRSGEPRCGFMASDTFDPLRELGDAVRTARAGNSDWTDCGWAYEGGEPLPKSKPGPVWPYGLAFDVLLGAGAVVVTIRRLRAPVRSLPKAVRIA